MGTRSKQHGRVCETATEDGERRIVGVCTFGNGRGRGLATGCWLLALAWLTWEAACPVPAQVMVAGPANLGGYVS